MKPLTVVGLLGLLASVTLMMGQGQREPLGSNPFGTTRHVIFGDIRVQEPEGGVKAAPTFLVTLTKIGGAVVGRDTVPSNGRFRFNGIQNGEYVLTVEVDTKVVYKEQFLLAEQRSTDIRKDIELMWTGTGVKPEGGVLYVRSSANQKKFDQAREMGEKGDHKAEAKLFKEILKSDGEDFEAATELGTALFLSRDYGDSEKAYRSALRAKDDYLPALVNLGKLLIAQKHYEDALKPLDQALQLDPQRAETNDLLGEAYLGMRKGSKAVGYLNEAIRLDPDGMADVHLRLGQLYDAAGLKDQAVNEFRQYLAKRPDSPQKAALEKYVAAHSATQ